MKKVLYAVFFLLINSLCFSQVRKTILGFDLNTTKEFIKQKLVDEKYSLIGNDNSNEIFPITIELYSKAELKFNNIPVRHISFTFCYDELICISLVTEAIDNLELLSNSRRIIKQKYNMEKKDYIDINEEFYDKSSNPSFYSCIDDQDFVLVIFGEEVFDGYVPQYYNFMYKSKTDEAMQLKNNYQSYNYIEDYTKMSLDELEKNALLLEQEKQEERKKIEKQKAEAEEKQRAEAQRINEEYNKKHRFDKFMGGFTGGYLGGGMYNGTNKGGFGALDFSYNFWGPFTIGGDLRLGNISSTVGKQYGSFRMDLDAYIALGVAIPIKRNDSPIIYIAVAPGGFLYQEKNLNNIYSKKYDAKFEGFVDLRAGIIVPIYSGWGFKFVYSREFTVNNGQMNLFSLFIGKKSF
ncbi:MAG: hypothetical protein K6A42_04130 [Treponema sp.]|nr:hypothetical protein [Treponema sp.]